MKVQRLVDNKANKNLPRNPALNRERQLDYIDIRTNWGEANSFGRGLDSPRVS